ncbi:hypothetical protein [Paenibacillus borealis]|uniref:hypothetical protein n=1 Tax=Paenibacillus borealis TaxID=160799 RepID=UPI0012FE6812|nr:hypothetical protein [Paenibacillus borealis]
MGENRDSMLISGCGSDNFSNAMGKIALRVPFLASSGEIRGIYPSNFSMRGLFSGTKDELVLRIK